MEAKIDLAGLVEARVAIRSCAEALSISDKHKPIVDALKDADEVLRRVMYMEE